MRTLFSGAVVALLALIVASNSAAQTTRWTMATAYADGNFHTRNIRAFIEDVGRSTNGRLAIQLHTGASLLPMPQIKRGVQTGQAQLGEVLLSVHGNEDPFFEVDSVPFLADSWEATAVLDRVSRPYINARLERQGLVPLFMVSWPSQGFYTRTELRTAEDLRGVRFRAYNVLTSRMAELLGATPVTVQVAEIPQAFATGIIAGMFTSAQTGVDTSAWDYARVFTDVGGMRARNLVFANARAFRALDEATRQAVTEAAARAEARGLELSRSSETEMLDRLRTRAMQVNTPSSQFLAQLREIGARQAQEWAQRAGSEGQQLIERYRAEIAR